MRRYVMHARPLQAAKATTRLFVSVRDGFIGANGVLVIVKRTVKAAGVSRPVNAHALRHACATHMLNHGADIRFVQELLGHAYIKSTQVYTHVSIGKLKETHRRCHPREQSGFMTRTED